MLRLMKQLGLSVILLTLLQACNKVDDYWLGKDNTPKPKKLPALKEDVQLKQAWKVSIGGRSTGLHEKLAPVVRGHHLYLATASGLVQDRDTRNGKLYWQRQLPEGISGGPAVGSGGIALGTSNAKLIFINAKDGRTQWENKLSNQTLAKPLIASGKVVVKTVNGHVHAFDLNTGKKAWVWQHGSPDLILKASSSPILIPPQMVLVGYPDGKLESLSLSDGNPLWQKDLIYASGATDVERLIDIDADPIYTDQLLLIGSYQGFVGALSLDDNRFIWRHPASIYQNMTLAQGQLYVTGDNDIIWSFNPSNGQTNWKQTQLKARRLTAPVWTPKGLMVADKTGMLHLVSAKDGALIGRQALAGAVQVPPVVSKQRAFLLTEKGWLYAIDLA